MPLGAQGKAHMRFGVMGVGSVAREGGFVKWCTVGRTVNHTQRPISGCFQLVACVVRQSVNGYTTAYGCEAHVQQVYCVWWPSVRSSCPDRRVNSP